MQTELRTIAAALLGWASLSFLSVRAADVSTNESNVDWLQAYEQQPDSQFAVVVFLENVSLQDAVHRAAALPDLSRAQRISTVSNRLRSYRPRFLNDVAEYLESSSSTPVKRLWIVPAFSATLERHEVEAVAIMTGVNRVVPDIQLEGIDPVDVKSAPRLSATISSQLQLLKVPSLWRLGLTGAGRLICSFDTGVDQVHPALARKWRGNHATLSSTWLSTVNPGPVPWDKSGHGTHTMGIMVGSEGGDTIGVAPGAEWIAAGVIDQGKTLSATISDILLAFQWALNPDGDPATTDDVPDVVLNSWGVPGGMFGPCDQTFWAAIDNVEAAGVVTIFSAGNEGPDAMTIRNPANRASSPTNSFAVGAVDDLKQIASFSSRGPVICNSASIKPEVVAPGVSIRSSAKGGGYSSMSGTSMAAPFIAGMVALCRQYNPDATTEQIKWALIQSAEDLGLAGEDNSYGFGLVDASRLLDYLDPPGSPSFFVSHQVISGDGVASPSETFDMQVVLVNPVGNVQQVTGHLVTSGPDGVTILRDSAGFYFGLGGTTAINSQPFEVSFDSTLYHGQEVSFALIVCGTNGQVYDSLDFSPIVGYTLTGSMADHDAGKIELTVTDIGQYGLAPGSIYNVNGRGFRYDGSDNLLYEAGIIVGRNYLQLSCSIRDSTGNFTPSDFAPVEPLGEEWLDADQGSHRQARMADVFSEVSIPVTIAQETIDYGTAAEDGMVVFKYHLVNASLERLTNLHFAFAADFDLSAAADRVELDESMGFIYQQSDGKPLVGLVALENITSHRSLDNGTGKIGFTRIEKFDLMTSATAVDPGLSGDLLFIAGGGPYDLEPLDSIEVAFALVAGHNRDQLYAQALQAMARYSLPTDVDDPVGSLPVAFSLSQNYPNPFNPTTAINFTLPSAQDVSLVIYNLLGQRVKLLRTGRLPAGQHTVAWNATDESGRQVASGVYFYRLTAGENSLRRKMLLLR
jgi:subtilisin family serine protease